MLGRRKSVERKEEKGRVDCLHPGLRGGVKRKLKEKNWRVECLYPGLI